MSDVWYYAESDTSVGPLSLADLKKTLSLVSNTKDILVWKSGFANWERAESVPELALLSRPPPIPPPKVSLTTAHQPTPKNADSGIAKQRKAVIIAAVVGLALAIVSNASTAISKGSITPLDSFNIFNPEVIAYWVGDLGFAPWFFIIIAAGLTARKAGLFSSIINTLGAMAVVSLVIIVSIIALAASQQKEFPVSEGPERSAFITSLLDSCVKRQQTSP